MQYENPEIQKLYDEVMEVHDAVMPEISTINKLKRTIRKIDPQDSMTVALIKELGDADEAMMSWMADFKPKKDQEESEQLAYLASEKLKISKVSDQMLGSINKAKAYLDTDE